VRSSNRHFLKAWAANFDVLLISLIIFDGAFDRFFEFAVGRIECLFISSLDTRQFSGLSDTLSNFAVSSQTASSPRVFTASMTVCTLS
jgi:hypothetical protein